MKLPSLEGAVVDGCGPFTSDGKFAPTYTEFGGAPNGVLGLFDGQIHREIGRPADIDYAVGRGVTSDGSRIAVHGFNAGKQSVGDLYIWEKQSGFTKINRINGMVDLLVRGTTQTLDRIVGVGSINDSYVAWSYEEGQGMQLINTPGEFSRVFGNSRDTRILVGETKNGAAYWDSSGLHEIGVARTKMFKATNDSRFFAGTKIGPPGFTEDYFKWTPDGGYVSLGAPANATYLDFVRGMSEDGSIILSGAQWDTYHSTINVNGTGWTRFDHYLNTMGIDTTGWRFTGADFVTTIGDTRVFTGSGLYNGSVHGFIVTVPEPSVVITSAAGCALLMRRRRRPVV